MSIRAVLSPCALLALAACGPTALTEIKLPAGPPAAPYTVAETSKHAGPNIIIDNADAAQIVVDGRTLDDLQRFAPADAPAGNGTTAIEYYRSPTNWNAPKHNLWRGKTNSGAGEAMYVATHQTEGYAIQTVRLARNGDTTMPVTGSANYSGLYVGSINVEHSTGESYIGNNSTYSIHGNVALAADFATARVSGAITERVAVDEIFGNSSTALSNLDLNIGGIENGEILGSVTGDDPADPATYLMSNGVYYGMFVGAGAEEIVGGIAVDLTRKNDAGYRAKEHGLFILNETP